MAWYGTVWSRIVWHGMEPCFAVADAKSRISVAKLSLATEPCFAVADAKSRISVAKLSLVLLLQMQPRCKCSLDANAAMLGLVARYAALLHRCKCSRRCICRCKSYAA